MKKVLSFVLVLAMVLGSVSMAFAKTETFSDVKAYINSRIKSYCIDHDSCLPFQCLQICFLFGCNSITFYGFLNRFIVCPNV